MRRSVLIYGILLLFAAGVSSCDKNINNDDLTIHVTGIEFEPNYFEQDGEYQGIDYKISQRFMTDAGIIVEPSIEASWTEAYEQTKNGSNRALLTLAYSEERADDFKWVGPTSQATYLVVAKPESGISTAIGLEAAKEIDEIAVVRDWMETKVLEDMGYTNLSYFDTYQEAYDAFMNDEVIAFATDGFHLAYVMGGVSFEALNIPIVYHSVHYYTAFSKDVDDKIIDDCQKALNDLIKNKFTLSTIQEFFPTANEQNIPGVIQIFTEIAPPFNFFTGPSSEYTVEGSSTDIVNEIQKRNGYTGAIKIGSWANGYNTVKYLPNSIIYTTARTPEREDLFQWVGPVSPLKTFFYTLSESGIQIDNIEQAKNLKAIATPLGWYTHDFLIKEGFDNIVATAFSPFGAFEQLLSGEVDALLIYDLGINWLCKQLNVPESSINEQLEASSQEGYIAFSLNTSSAIVQEWQQHLDDMKDDGTYDDIWNKWYK